MMCHLNSLVTNMYKLFKNKLNYNSMISSDMMLTLIILNV